LPENFADVEALAKSYREAQAWATRLSQQVAEQEGQLEAFFASQDEQVVAEPRRQQSREQQLQTMQRLAEQAAERGARQVVKAVSSGRVPAPEDPAVLSRVTREIMPRRDPRWAETNPDVLAEIISERPDLVGDLTDLNSVVGGLSTAAELARGRQYERTLSAWSMAEETRQAKLSAQTLSGVGGRIETDEDSEFFERLKAAHNQTYSMARANS
jgi:hypothetical protein